jgi:hypothetical protein
MFNLFKRRNKDYECRLRELEPHFKPAKRGQSRFIHINLRTIFGRPKKIDLNDYQDEPQSEHHGIALFITCLIILGAIIKFSPWPPMLTLRHIASLPNCKAARLMGLAPAKKGNPGYYPWHDADNDNIACESSPQ